VAKPEDFLDESIRGQPYQVAQNAAGAKNLLCPQVKAEVDKLLWADLVIFHFPLWWFSMPAILKGWVDRVVINGMMYSKGRWYGNGVFRGKRAFATLTTGAPETAYSKTGINGYMKDFLFPIQHGIFHFLGMDVIDPFIVYGSAYVSEKEREEMLLKYKKKLSGIEHEMFTPPPDIDQYDHRTWKKLDKGE
jgi:NAD(P)H dehydrogenase (quinone)